MLPAAFRIRGLTTSRRFPAAGIIRDECGPTPVAPVDEWRGGELMLRPGRPCVQERSLRSGTFFHKIVMLRNQLRVLEQQINSLTLPEDVKVKLRGCVTGCYGALTSFNVFFAEEDDRFRGSANDCPPQRTSPGHRHRPGRPPPPAIGARRWPLGARAPTVGAIRTEPLQLPGLRSSLRQVLSGIDST